MDPTLNQPEPDEGAGANSRELSGEGGDWSPFDSTRARWAWGLLAAFAVIYFVVAILTSATFADLAATEVVFGLPLGFILGMGVIVAGLVITRIYLSKVEG